MNSRPARSVVGTWTWFRSRCTCQVSLQRLMRRHPLPLTGFLGLVPPLPRYSEVLRLPAAHFAALRFLRWAIPSLRPWFVPPAPDAEPWINRELVGGISSRLARWKRQGLPSSRRNPCDHSPYSSDPGVTRQAEWTMSELPGAAPATDHDEGSPRVLISGLNRTGAIPKRGDFDSTIRSLPATTCDKMVEDPRSAFNFAGKIHLPTTVSGESSVSENLAPDALEN